MNQNDQIREALRREFPLLDEIGLDQELHHCEWSIQQERKRLHHLLDELQTEQALNHTSDTGKMGNHVGDANKMLELFDQVVSPAILNCIGKIAEEITVRRIWDEVRQAMLKNNGVRHD